MGIGAQEVRRSRLLVSLLAVCLGLAAILQLNGRSILAVGEGKAGAFATLVQPDPKGVAGGLTPATGPIGRLLNSASRSFGNPHPRAGTPADGAPAAGTAGSSGTSPGLASGGTPSTVPAASAATGDSSARNGSGGLPEFGGLLSQLSPISGPSGFVPTATPTPQPTGSPTPQPTTTPGPTPTPTPEPTATPPVNPTPTPTPPVIEPTPTPPVIDPTPTPFPTPTPPIIDPTGPVSPVPEPAAWALWLLGFGVVGSLIRWRRRALDAVAAEDVGGDVA
jgi:hypothetical protein